MFPLRLVSPHHVETRKRASHIARDSSKGNMDKFNHLALLTAHTGLSEPAKAFVASALDTFRGAQREKATHSGHRASFGKREEDAQTSGEKFTGKVEWGTSPLGLLITGLESASALSKKLGAAVTIGLPAGVRTEPAKKEKPAESK